MDAGPVHGKYPKSSLVLDPEMGAITIKSERIKCDTFRL